MKAKKFMALCLAVLIAAACTAVCVSAAENDGGFTVTATSNIADAVSQTYSERDKTVTVTYYLKADKKLLNGDWYLTYDPTVLKLDENTQTMPVISANGEDDRTNLQWDYGVAYGQFLNYNLYDFTGVLGDNVFVTATFDIVGDYTRDTVIDLDVFMLSGGLYFEDTDGMMQVASYNYVQISEPSELFLAESQRLAVLSEPQPEPTTQPTTVPTDPTETAPTETVPTETTETEPTATVPTETTETEPTATVPTETTETEPTATVPTKTTETESTATVPTETTETEPTATVPTETTETEPTATVPTETTETEPTATVPTETTETEPTATVPTEATKPTDNKPTEPPATPDEPKRLPGDANCDGEVNIKDAAAMQLHLAKLYTGEIDLTVCDVNGDGEFNIKDAAYLQLKLANLI